MISIFTDDFRTCYVTGRSGHVEVHHVFGQAYRTKSTFYGFVVPLLAEIHPNGAFKSDKDCKKLIGKSLKELDLSLRQYCQRYYEEELGKTREEWLKEFDKNYL